jgi:hypothetical protein
MRAIEVQSTIEMMTTMRQNPAAPECAKSGEKPSLVRSTAPSTISRGSSGSVIMPSVMRISTASVRPPKYPAAIPTPSPMTPPNTVASSPTSSEICPPTISRINSSRPASSVPSQWSAEGGSKRDSRSVAEGSMPVSA